MTKFRRRWRVVVDGQTYDELVTNALDMARAERAEDEGNSMGMSMRTVHEAMLRTKLPVPSRFDAFLLVLEELDDLDAEPVDAGEDDPPDTDSEAPGGLPDPTQPAD